VVLTEMRSMRIEKVHTSKHSGYDYYLRGRQFFISAPQSRNLRARCARGVVIDPGYAALTGAWTMLRVCICG